ncbi:MAG: META domain-containing protein [Muribaculaceae bacterium]|nr:META domain-containing protein [Muribaculaceae bacterium]MDE6832555.1 META domain-containing protein [Muribaculaceae bacterium]
MKSSLLAGLAITAVAALTSCSSVKSIPVENLSGEWSIKKINGDRVKVSDETVEPYLAFDVVNSRFFGHAGCNSIMGSFATGEDNEIEFTSTGVTMMMCPDIATEDALLKALASVKQYNINDNGDLELSSASDRTLVALTKRPDTLSPLALDGEWQVTSLGELDMTEDADNSYTITFNSEDDTFAMTTDCNTVSGKYAGSFVDINFSGLRTTRMACPSMEIERTASELLPTITSFSELGDDNAFAFYDAHGQLVMMINRTTE